MRDLRLTAAACFLAAVALVLAGCAESAGAGATRHASRTLLRASR